MKQILSALVFLSALTGCKIEDPDFFVPEVAFAAAEKEVVFEPAGGTESFSVEANCDWSVSCPAEWVTLSVEAGDRNGTVEIAVKPTKLPRNTTITLYSNEVESRTSSRKESWRSAPYRRRSLRTSFPHRERPLR